ncbi:hypothetical protein BD410DRAFT_99681 [Rickenella mellea]|uniref:Uncharacterized protein n=1 Tax=Rickenella mellea TaxID=50990 RepID=A0A4Y7PL36_9AGAM|nr:hypothetical protein BD410DRAFT_99681 [Rickenella mellea]
MITIDSVYPRRIFFHHFRGITWYDAVPNCEQTERTTITFSARLNLIGRQPHPPSRRRSRKRSLPRTLLVYRQNQSHHRMHRPNQDQYRLKAFGTNMGIQLYLTGSINNSVLLYHPPPLVSSQIASSETFSNTHFASSASSSTNSVPRLVVATTTALSNSAIFILNATTTPPKSCCGGGFIGVERSRMGKYRDWRTLGYLS